MVSGIEKTKVLIVDDIPENIKVLENALADLDLEIVSASSGNEALKATLYNDFSLIILDILMPGMNGLEVADMLKQDEATSDIPIIFVTAMDRDEDYELKAYSKGAIDFIYKPLNLVVLISKVKALLYLYSMKKDVERAFIRHETGKPKILIVDDTPENLLVLRKLLAKLEVEVIEARSGNDALTKTLYNDFAVIFLDVQMPEMDGYEVAEILKSEDKTSGIPIIFITAIDRDDTKEIKGYDKGAVDFIFKPFNEFILLSKARVFLDIYKMRAGLEGLVAERTSALEETNRKLKDQIQSKEIVEQELLKTRTYLTSVVNSISSILIGVDNKGVIIEMNTQAERCSVLSRVEALGKSVEDAFPFLAQPLLELMELVGNNEPVEKTSVVVEVDNRKMIYNLAAFPLVGAGSEQVVIRIDDITDTKEMENELNQRRHMESLGQLAGGVAHDFNNMLSAIMGATELLGIKINENPDNAKLINSIMTSVERAADLTGKLLSFARNKGGEKSFVDMHRIIKDTVSILQRSIDKRIRLVEKLDASKPTIMGDDSELSNALLNLAINARDAMPDGGDLTISTMNMEIHDLPRSERGELEAGQYIRISVLDTGTGMTEEVKSRAFEPFYTTKEPGQGTGLGLASVYGTIKAHSGLIRMESTLGEGSIFTILLPVCEAVESEKKPAVQDDTEVKLQGTALLVDDEEVIRAVGVDLLREIGMKVLTAENGPKAIDIMREKGDEITVILLDMIMPVMNGPDCYREIRRIKPDAKIIICSGYAPEEMISKLRLEGLEGFIQKPFRLDRLRMALSACLGARGRKPF
ncbi:response regulator [Desulfopila sp. IMCC35008]|uniref:ATP-binding response regulator n=1 Tax=Desulfopila sp. IMCC35008 TaxID=2653858 RepID=UPI0013D1A581|nr:response regulator [Desulfopila sp. IMCC35008]